jgi:hypothetical protein
MTDETRCGIGPPLPAGSTSTYVEVTLPVRFSAGCPCPDVFAVSMRCSGHDPAARSSFYVCSRCNCIPASVKAYAVAPRTIYPRGFTEFSGIVFSSRLGAGGIVPRYPGCAACCLCPGGCCLFWVALGSFLKT